MRVVKLDRPDVGIDQRRENPFGLRRADRGQVVQLPAAGRQVEQPPPVSKLAGVEAEPEAVGRERPRPEADGAGPDLLQADDVGLAAPDSLGLARL